MEGQAYCRIFWGRGSIRKTWLIITTTMVEKSIFAVNSQEGFVTSA